MAQKSILAIRIRGGVNASTRVEDTLKMLRLEKNMASTLLDDRPSYMGMLQHAKDYLTWGEPTIETIQLLLGKRGKLAGNNPIDENTLKGLGFDSFNALAKALHSTEVEFHKLKGIKPFFRLHPPKKGFKRSVKRPYKSKGELGDRGEKINELAKRMV
jgi:large subunit ribosomal protein L30